MTKHSSKLGRLSDPETKNPLQEDQLACYIARKSWQMSVSLQMRGSSHKNLPLHQKPSFTRSRFFLSIVYKSARQGYNRNDVLPVVQATDDFEVKRRL